ncbi:MAG TPA: hypothetical protein VFS23_14315 [Vicinamibacterales bacterium]|nr:hypothetical protein [Vicinamibacterales bacterium]
MTFVTRIRSVLSHLWQSDRVLTGSALLMLGALAVFLAGMLLDPRIVTGAPAWLKPAKFAISTAIYMFTLAWIFTYLRDWPKVRRVVGRATAAIFIAEVAVIALQAWRGTTSHFNVSTPLDGALFAFMGGAIVAQTLMSVSVAVALWRQSFHDRALGWALRLGMVITIAGASMGGMMTRPTEAQLAHVAATGQMPIVGAHTVGAPDGGPGLPGTGWSVEHGDVRVPHFLGLHALQLLPVLAWLLWRRRINDVMRARLVIVGGGSYATLVLIMLWQALRGQSLVSPDAMTLGVFAVWALVTGMAAVWPFRSRPAASDATLNWINP